MIVALDLFRNAARLSWSQWRHEAADGAGGFLLIALLVGWWLFVVVSESLERRSFGPLVRGMFSFMGVILFVALLMYDIRLALLVFAVYVIREWIKS